MSVKYLFHHSVLLPNKNATTSGWGASFVHAEVSEEKRYRRDGQLSKTKIPFPLDFPFPCIPLVLTSTLAMLSTRKHRPSRLADKPFRQHDTIKQLYGADLSASRMCARLRLTRDSVNNRNADSCRQRSREVSECEVRAGAGEGCCSPSQYATRSIVFRKCFKFFVSSGALCEALADDSAF